MKTEIDQIYRETDQLETRKWKTSRKGDLSIFDPRIIRRAIPDAFKKLDPRVQLKNPVMFVALIPLALRGVKFRPIGAGPLLRRNLLLYGVGGIIIPFIGIKLIDLILVALHLTL